MVGLIFIDYDEHYEDNTGRLLLAIGDIVNNLFLLLYLAQFDALACDKSVHFLFYSCSLLCVANRVSHLSRFHPLSSEIGKSDTDKNAKHVV